MNYRLGIGQCVKASINTGSEASVQISCNQCQERGFVNFSFHCEMDCRLLTTEVL